jgi:hypothetical protein
MRTVVYDTGSGSAAGYGVVAGIVAAGAADDIGTSLLLEVDTTTGTELVRVKSITGSESSGSITVGENGISFADNQVIRIRHFFQPVAIPPAIRSGVFYKDFDRAFTSAYATQPNPVTIIGSHLAGFLSAGSIVFSLNSSSSYAIANGATISSRTWSCARNGGGTTGISFSSTTAANPTLTITQAGTYWLACQTVDSNGKSQTTHRAVFVYDSDNLPYQSFTIDNLSADWDSGQWRCNLTLTGALTLANIPDGSLAVIWYQNYFNNVEGYVNMWSPFGNNIVYSGYLWSDNDSDNWQGGTGKASFEVISPLQYLDSITDYGTVSLEASSSPLIWSDYATWLSVGRGIHHVLKWDTTLLEVCDVRGLTTNTYGVKVLEFTEDTVLQRIQGIAYQRGIHAKLLCNRIGQLYLSTDSQMLNTAGRAALDTVFSLTTNDISGGVNVTRNNTDVRAFADTDGFTYSHPTRAPYISMIPGYIESTVSYNLPELRGTGVAGDKQQVLNVADGQTDCNERVGRTLALENVTPKEIRIDMRGNYLGAFDIVPAEGWYGWTVADNTLKRELPLNGILTVCRAVSHRFGYEGDRFNGVIQTTGVVLQPEAVGPDGIPGNYPTSYPAITTPAPISASSRGPSLIAYVDASDGQIKARIISYSGSLSIGNEVVVDASGGRVPTVVSLSTTKAVVCYTRSTSIYGCVLDVSGTTITPGSPAALSSISTDAGVSDGELDLDRISSTSALLVYRNASSTVNAVVLSGMSGTTITTNTAGNLTATASAQVSSVVLSSTVAIAFFIESVSDSLVGCSIGMSGVTVTPGSPAAIEGVDNNFGQDAVKLDSSTAILVYQNNSNAQLQGRVISGITASAFTSNTEVVIDDSAFDAISANKWLRAPSATQAVLAYQGDTPNLGHIYAVGLAISGTTFTPSNPVEVGTFEESYDQHATCALISNTRALVVYDESGLGTVGAHARSFTFTGSTDPVADNNDVEFMSDSYNQEYEFTSTTLEA